ncbi:MAG: hypothetical protein IJU56_03205 [Clostridia bacterium]|nr:hypothetical protein [Clostridia bacterium]
MKTTNRTSVRLFFSLLLALLLLVCAAVSASAVATTVNVDFCDGHEALAQQLASYLGTEADGAVVPVSLTLESEDEKNVLSAIYKIEDLLLESGISLDLFSGRELDNGEQYYGFATRPMTAFENRDDYRTEQNSQWGTPLNDGDTLFVLWKTPAESIEVTIAAPVCGTEVVWANDLHDGCYPGNTPHTHPSPEITVTGDAVLFQDPYHGGEYAQGIYVDNAEGNMAYSSLSSDGYFQGIVEGGQSYYVAFRLEAAFNRFLGELTPDTIKINGGTLVHQDGSLFVAFVPAVHQSGEVEISAAPTCTEPGTGTYFCAGCEKTIYDVIPATGHAWGEPVWSWSEDGMAATATFTCTNCDHPETVEATVTADDALSFPATCTADGQNVYNAVVTLDGEEYTAEKTVIIPAAHTYDNAEWRWAKDCSLAVATLTCTVCSEKKAVIAEISESKTEPTAAADGEIVYTATVTLGTERYSDVQRTVLPATGADTPAPQNETDGKSGEKPNTGSFLSRLLSWLTDLFRMFTRWITE